MAQNKNHQEDIDPDILERLIAGKASLKKTERVSRRLRAATRMTPFMTFQPLRRA